uniref:ZP domain-containing protein n=1 Tax=Panagrellus redivivus TaxID=6233 RepID=A0A7E4VGH6_PANRE
MWICANFVVFAVFVGFVKAIPVDNGVEGDPEIECGPNGMQITFTTRNPFNGRLFVKGHHDDQDCRNEQIGRQITGITLNFDSCGVQRLRSLNPRGIFATTTIVISFHPIFVTKVDRVYHVQCFYMEADKTVSQGIEVSDLTTAFVTQLVPMPICRYDVLDGGPSGSPVSFATVGQQVYHKFTCDSETIDTFCMVVHSCFVDDGNGDTFEMLDTRGCAIDRHVLNNLEYPTDLMAGQEAHVFKYADRSALFFQCQVSISVKEPGSVCSRPSCADPVRGRRHVPIAPRARKFDYDFDSLSLTTMDVASQRIETLDAFDLPPYESRPVADVPSRLKANASILTEDLYCVNAFVSASIFAVLLGISFAFAAICSSKRWIW